MTVRVGIIGTGAIAQAHAATLAAAETGKVIAVHDVVDARAQRMAEEFGVPCVARSVDELVARPDVDAVIVATPPAAHAAATIKALSAGKHVLCEKPLALDVAEAELMVQAARHSGAFLACASARDRFLPGHQYARRLIEQGELGEVYHVRVTRWRVRGRPGHHYFPESPWFLDHAKAGGGVMMDLAVYQIDTALWLLGNPRVEAVTAQMRQLTEEPIPRGATQDVEDHAVIMLQCAQRKSAVIETAWVSNMKVADSMTVLGTKAGLRFDPLTKITVAPLGASEVSRLRTGWLDHRLTEIPIELPPALDLGPGDIARHFVEAIAAGRQPDTPGEDALEITRVIAAAYRSADDSAVSSLSAAGT